MENKITLSPEIAENLVSMECYSKFMSLTQFGMRNRGLFRIKFIGLYCAYYFQIISDKG